MSIVEHLRQTGIKAAVLYGGPGVEREVSLASGEMVFQALEKTGLDVFRAVVPVEGAQSYLQDLECGLAVMMLHGEFGEDGTAQGILERRGIPFTGSDSKACALAMDKNAAKELFQANAVPTPRWLMSDNPEKAAAMIAAVNMHFPLFIKPNFGGSSVGVRRVEALGDVMQAVEETLRVGKLALIEELVTGRELTIGWLDGKVLPIIELKAEGVFYDYDAKYLSEKTRYECPAVLPAKVEREVNGLVLQVVELLGARDLARADIMLGEEGPMVLELNTLPGFTSHSLVPMAAAAAGMGMEELCLSLVEMAAKRAGIA